jgi:hypothetical protein
VHVPEQSRQSGNSVQQEKSGYKGRDCDILVREFAPAYDAGHRQSMAWLVGQFHQMDEAGSPAQAFVLGCFVETSAENLGPFGPPFGRFRCGMHSSRVAVCAPRAGKV